jgi:hypothetical protein
MVNDKIIDKIQKLLRLAESADVHEAAAAAAQAQRLMEQHRIDQAMLGLDKDAVEGDDVAEYDDDRALFHAPRLPTWRTRLAAAVARVNACQTFRSTSWHDDEGRYVKCIGIVGTADNVATVRYLFKYLAGEIDRLCRREAAGRGRTWANSFRLGAVQEVRRKLNEAKARVRAEMWDVARMDGTTAIMRLGDAVTQLDEQYKRVSAYIDNMDLRAARKDRADRDWRAFAQGRHAARDIDVDSPSRRLVSGANQVQERSNGS